MAFRARQLRSPPGGDDVVWGALQDLAASEGSSLAGRFLRISQPLPTYTLGLDDLLAELGPARARQTGWRYLVEQGQPDGKAVAHYIDLAIGQKDKVAFTTLATNANADRLLKATHKAQEILNKYDFAHECEPRLLDVPALNVSALWLIVGPDEWFIPYIDGSEERRARPIAPEQEFLGRLWQEAAATAAYAAAASRGRA